MIGSFCIGVAFDQKISSHLSPLRVLTVSDFPWRAADRIPSMVTGHWCEYEMKWRRDISRLPQIAFQMISTLWTRCHQISMYESPSRDFARQFALKSRLWLQLSWAQISWMHFLNISSCVYICTAYILTHRCVFTDICSGFDRLDPSIARIGGRQHFQNPLCTVIFRLNMF